MITSSYPETAVRSSIIRGELKDVSELASKPFVHGDVWIVGEDAYICTGEIWAMFPKEDSLAKLFPPSIFGDFSILVHQLAAFVQHRKVRLLTRKANSQKDSHVEYETVFPKDVKFGNAQVFIRVDEDKVVAAVNVTETTKVFEDFWSKEPTLNG